MLFYENRYKAKASSIASLYFLCCSLQSLPTFSKNLDFYRNGITALSAKKWQEYKSGYMEKCFHYIVVALSQP